MMSDIESAGRSNAALACAGVLMILCCAVGPAVLGAVAGGAIGGWLGIACAVIGAGAVALSRLSSPRATGRIVLMSRRAVLVALIARLPSR
jgi:hypothetical protein